MIRKTLKILYYIVVLTALLAASVCFAVQSPKIQTYIGLQAVNALRDKIDGAVSFGKIHIDPFRAVVIEDIAIVDKHPYIVDPESDIAYYGRIDTLFKAQSLSVTFTPRNLFGAGGISLGKARVYNAVFALTIEPGDTTSSTSNLKRIFRLHKGKGEKSDKEVFSIRDVEVRGMRFVMKNFKKASKGYESDEINWMDMDVTDINIDGRNLKMKGPVISGVCDNMSFREKSGFKCYRLSGKTRSGNGTVLIEDVHIVDTWSNVNIPRFRMTYKDMDSWANFITDVKMDADVDMSDISFRTLGFFAPALKTRPLDFEIRDGSMNGYVNDLSIKDIDFLEKNTNMSGKVSGSIVGLPDVQTMMTDFQVSGLGFTTQALNKMIKAWAPRYNGDISRICAGRNLVLDGHGRGPLNRMRIGATISSRFGKAYADLDVRNLISKTRDLEIGGNIESKDLDLGTVTGARQLGPVSMVTGLHSTIGKKGISARIDSLQISRLNALGYDYSGIAAAGTYNENAFDGRIVCNDPNLSFLFQGLFTFSKKSLNALYHFYANVGYADLHALNLDKRGTSRIRFATNADFNRINREDVVGNIGITGLVLEDENGIHDIGNISIAAHTNDDVNRIRLTSKFADGSYVGSKFLMTFIKDLQSATTARALPSLYQNPDSTWSGNNYTVSLKFHDTKDILSFFVPGMYIADSTSISLRLDQSGALDARLKSKRLAMMDKYIKDVDLSVDNGGGQLNGNIFITETSISPILLKDNHLQFIAGLDRFGVGLSFDNNTQKTNRGELYLVGDLSRDDKDSLVVSADIVPSNIYFNGSAWKIAQCSATLSHLGYAVDSLLIENEMQSIVVDGNVSRTSHKDTLGLMLSNFDVDICNSILKKDMDIQGKVNGHAMLVTSGGKVNGLMMNLASSESGFAGHSLGMVRMASVLEEEQGRVNFLCRNEMEGKHNLDVSGYIYPEDRTVDGRIVLDSLNVGYAYPFLSSIFSETSGNISGTVAFSGPLSKLELNGQGLVLDNVRMKVAFTNVGYTANGLADINSSGVIFRNVDISDRFGARGNVNGSINWHYMKDLDFDTHLSFTDLEVMDTGEADNPIFYGNLFASGTLDILGPLNALRLSASARTEKSGAFHVPLSSASVAGQSDLLTFTEEVHEIAIDPYEEMLGRLKTREKKKNELGIRLHIEATPAVEAYIELDKQNGNLITGTGNGIIDLNVEPSKKVFDMNGNYTIAGGDFHFVALGIAKRDFTLQEGGNIRFNGDIMNTDLDVSALYKTKASVGTLISDTTAVSSRRNVECTINVSDKLRNPRLSFAINIPDLDPTTQARVESALNSDDKIQRQFLALLVTNSFVPDEQSGIVNNSSMLYSNVSEIMAGQLNNILQKLNIPVDFGLDYQQTSNGSDIFDVALSTALFNNRVIVNGTIGNRQYEAGTSSSEVVGDLDIDVKLDKQGSLRLNLFSHSADQYTSYLDNSQRNGVGITYQKEYDNLWDFLRNMFRTRKKRQEIELRKQQMLQNGEMKEIQITGEEN